MITNQLVADLSAMVAREAHSALPNAPVRPEPEQAPRGSLLAAARLQITGVLRWAADAIEPATRQAEVAPAGKQSGC
jgi:hypothetical protein